MMENSEGKNKWKIHKPENESDETVYLVDSLGKVVAEVSSPRIDRKDREELFTLLVKAPELQQQNTALLGVLRRALPAVKTEHENLTKEYYAAGLSQIELAEMNELENLIAEIEALLTDKK